ncbi:MAG: GDP-L-fucose synthase [Geminicoccaceae bacterium]|nr:GDP-L-fucose synthase [Geminicoccaceae bacterium]MCS7266988.1 GDP-L-fucose synthase [Geminicoccaceae bacterium]MCX7628785.1 GDP-L-fucose synthase [Geminicoccaceae bacterium]
MTPRLPFPLEGKRIFVAGHRGMVGKALLRRLAGEPVEILTAGRDVLDLTRQAEVEAWFERNRPQVVILAAAKVGGILANASFPVDFLEQNLLIEVNTIRAAHRFGVEKLLFLGSSCIYPKFAPQPIPEEALLTGPLEPTNEWYAIAKIAGLKLCAAYRRQYGCDFISAMPTNLYGPGDNWDLATSHVVAALIRKAHEAKMRGASSLEVWGSGTPLREFLFVDDLADACVFLLRHYSDELAINLGSGEEVSIAELARLICEIVGFRGTLRFDPSKPDGTPRKRLDLRRLEALGWRPRTPLREGLARAYAAFLEETRDRLPLRDP